MPAGTECKNAMPTVGTPASSPPTRGRKSTRTTQIASTEAKGTPVSSRVMKTTTPAITEVAKSPSMKPVTCRLISAAIRRNDSPRSSGNHSSVPSTMPGPSRTMKKETKPIVTRLVIPEKTVLPTDSAGLPRPVMKLSRVCWCCCT